ncbi:MAG TPA: M20/M25/M40 family metallo-hydrolase, partial [Thermomicrobiales bacterium]|nr:M20/M25/M40 family metallo-hydrolase [Thermomicrobiales bacterium]
MAEPSADLAATLAACRANQQRDLDDLCALLRQPSIIAQNIGVAECADLFLATLQNAGFAARLLPTPAHPVIYGEWTGAPGKPTVLIYGHYDVQPPEPLTEWLSPPFEPTVRDGKVFARGAGDNKGQIFAQIAAARAWLETAGVLPVNVKFLIEGEEETGSPHLAAVVAAHRDLLAADLVYTSDGPVHDDAHPQVVYGVRGLLYVELRARGASHDLHSGKWGGVAPNPAWTLVELLASMRDGDGRVTIPGFYDDVRPPTLAFTAAMERIPLDQPAALATVGLDRLPPPADAGYFERLMTTPTLNI